MSQTDEEGNRSETDEEAQESKLEFVPVIESIRYRRRAQSAEKKIELLAEELSEAKDELAKLNERLKAEQAERELTGKLASAGAVDLEAAMLIAKLRMGGEKEANPDAVIEQMKKEKSYLFGRAVEGSASKKTAGVKDNAGHAKTATERAARRAAKTGSRIDLQEYLKLRRSNGLKN